MLGQGCLRAPFWRTIYLHLTDLFSSVLFAFLPFLLATPLPPLLSARFRHFLPLEKCSVL